VSDYIQLYFLDKDLKRLDVIVSFTSLIWTERYYALGEFSIQLTSDYFYLLKASKYIYRADKKTCGIIEGYSITNQTIIIKGRFMEAILTNYVIYNELNLTDTPENIASMLIQDLLINDTDRGYKYLTMGPISDIDQPIIESQATKINLYEYISALLIANELWYKIDLDIKNKQFIFFILKGIDRTVEQNVNTKCIFSQKFHNLVNENFVYAGTKANVAYAIGNFKQKEKEDIEIIEIIDIRENGNEDRKEIIISPSINNEDEVTEETFREQLKNKGQEELKKQAKTYSGNFEVIDNNVMYYALGDKVTYENEQTNFIASERIIEIDEVVEVGNINKTIKIGKDNIIELRRKLMSGNL
jgi:hypothetical protein